MENNLNSGDAAAPHNTSPNIDSKQVSKLLEIHIRDAQVRLKKTREALGKPKNASVTVKEFSLINYLPEDEILKALEHLSTDSD